MFALLLLTIVSAAVFAGWPALKHIGRHADHPVSHPADSLAWEAEQRASYLDRH